MYIANEIEAAWAAQLHGDRRLFRRESSSANVADGSKAAMPCLDGWAAAWNSRTMHPRHPVLAPLHCLQLFAQAVKVKRLLEEVALDPKINFWVYTTNVLLNEAAIQWSKVFGSTEEQTHWTKSFDQTDREQMRNQLYQHLGMTKNQWREYRATVVDFRNQMAAHHDLNAAIQKYPHFDVALNAADFMYGQLLKQVPDDNGGGLAWQGLLKWADHVSRHMGPIVARSFEASAALLKKPESK
jgi:hypothetical protein